MNFATPWVGAIAAAIAIPTLLILYFLKLRRRDVEVSTTLLWKKAIQDLQANAPFQKLRRNILLILQLIALIAALIALAQPEFKDTATTASRHIIVLDRSASMSSTDGVGGPEDENSSGGNTSGKVTRLDEAKRRAIELVDSLREPSLFDDKGEEAMVIAFDRSATVVQNFTASKSTLREAIRAVQPTDGPSILDEAFRLAKAYAGTQKFEEEKGFVPTAPPSNVHLFTDGVLPGADKVVPSPEDTVLFHRVGTMDAANVAITGLRARRAFDEPDQLQIFVGIQSTAREDRVVDVEVQIDGVTSTVRDVTIRAAQPPVNRAAPDSPADSPDAAPASEAPWTPGVGGFVIPLDRPTPGIAAVTISTKEPDALPSDNVAYVIIPPAKRVKVALITPGDLWLRSALESLNLSSLDVFSPETFQAAMDDGSAGEFDVLVFHRTLPVVAQKSSDPAVPPRTGPGIPPGRSLVLGIVPPPPLGANDDGEGGFTQIVEWKRDHPALRLASLEKINIEESRLISLVADTPVKVIAQDITGPAILEIEDGQTKAIVVPFDPAASDWPWDPGFLLFLANSLAYLADAAPGGESTDMIQPGGELVARLPTSPGREPKSVKIRPPGSAEQITLEPSADGRVAFGPIRRTGVYRLTWQGDPAPTDQQEDDGSIRRDIAANILDPIESDVQTRPGLALASKDVAAQGEGQAKLTRKVWPWLILAALAVVMLEWFVYNKKVQI